MRYLTKTGTLLALAMLIGGFCGPMDVGAAPETAAATSQMVAAGQRYVATLSRPQRRVGVRTFQDAERQRWSFLPGKRPGITLRSMNAAQREAALALVRTGLSASGWTKLQGIFTLERILRAGVSATQRRTNPTWRDPLLYTLTLFGAPGISGRWGWRFGGHHVSLNFTCHGGVPRAERIFFGASPARVLRGQSSGLAPLAEPESRAFALLQSLRLPQQRVAVEAPRIPGGLLAGPGQDPRRVSPAGLQLSAMDAVQQAALWHLTNAYLSSLTAEAAERFRRRAQSQAPAQVRFVWRGGGRPGSDHYYRIQGPGFVVEYWKNGNHIHSHARDLVQEGLVRAAAR